MVIYDAPGYLKIVHEEEKGYIAFQWEKFGIPFDKALEGHKAALETAKRKNCPYYLANTANAKGTLLPTVVDWFVNTWIPVLKKEGLVAVITVVPTTSSLAKMSTKSWQAFDNTGLIMGDVNSVAEAEDTFRQIKASKKK